MGRKLAIALVALALAAPGAAQAVTVGAPLNVPPSTNSGCEALVYTGPPPPSCTLLGNASPAHGRRRRRAVTG